jgi:hypothetical protein
LLLPLLLLLILPQAHSLLLLQLLLLLLLLVAALDLRSLQVPQHSSSPLFAEAFYKDFSLRPAALRNK